MKFTYNWLKEYCPCDLPVSELVELLTKHGVKVETFEPTPDGKDTLITLEITANRPDCLSLLGIAREVALITGQKVLPRRPHSTSESIEKSKPNSFIQVLDRELCPIYIGRIIKGVKVGPSPEWLRNLMESIGLHSVNNIVDITNYVLMETGQPLHAFDYNALGERKIIVRLAKPGEKMMAINGKEYELAKDTLVIADAHKPVAIAGIMGGKQTEVVERTTDILLESAYFQPASIRKSSRWLKLASDSSYRFERGVVPEYVLAASDRAVELILSLAGGRMSGQQEVNCYKAESRRVTLHLERLETLLGVGIDTPDLKRILKGLGLIPKREWKHQIDLEVPCFRNDINLEVDVIEEVVRIIGYDNIPSTPLAIELKSSQPDKLADAIQATRLTLFGLGYNEVMTPSFFASKAEASGTDLISGQNMEPLGLLDTENNVSLYLRTSLSNSLSGVFGIHNNYKKDVPVHIFEIAKVYWRGEKAPVEKLHLGLLDTKGVASIKGALSILFNKLGIQHIYNGTLIMLADKSVGGISVGSEGYCYAELDFEEIVSQSNLSQAYKEFSRMPAISRDLAVVVDESVIWGRIEHTVRRTLEPVQTELPLESLNFFDIYRGKQIPAGKKSIAFSMTFRHPTKTLSAIRADEVMTAVIGALQKDLNATIR